MRAGDGEADHWTLIPTTSPSLHPDSLTQESMCKCLLNPDFSFRQQLLGFFPTKTQSSFKYLNCRSKSVMLPIWSANCTENSYLEVFWATRGSRRPAASQVALVVKNLPAMQEMQIRSLGGEDPLEEGMKTHSSILSWRIPWTEEPGGLQSIGSQRVGHNWSNLACMHAEGLGGY